MLLVCQVLVLKLDVSSPTPHGPNSAYRRRKFAHRWEPYDLQVASQEHLWAEMDSSLPHETVERISGDTQHEGALWWMAFLHPKSCRLVCFPCHLIVRWQDSWRWL